MKLTKEQERLMLNLAIGERTQVLTSQYADSRLVRANLEATGQGKDPITYSTHAAVNGLIKRGLLTGRKYWRGFEVIRLA